MKKKHAHPLFYVSVIVLILSLAIVVAVLFIDFGTHSKVEYPESAEHACLIREQQFVDYDTNTYYQSARLGEDGEMVIFVSDEDMSDKIKFAHVNYRPESFWEGDYEIRDFGGIYLEVNEFIERGAPKMSQYITDINDVDSDTYYSIKDDDGVYKKGEIIIEEYYLYTHAKVYDFSSYLGYKSNNEAQTNFIVNATVKTIVVVAFVIFACQVVIPFIILGVIITLARNGHGA